MKKMLLLVFFMGLTNLVNAQNEFLNQNNTLAPSGSSLNTPKSILPSVFSPNNNVKSSRTIPETKGIQFSQNNNFANPGDVIKEKLNRKTRTDDEENDRPKKENEYYGDFKTKSSYVVIGYRDFGDVDGDEIKVSLNGRVVIDRIYLDSNFKGFQLDLVKGINKIDFEALNQGELGANTGEFQTFDDKKIIITENRWNLFTGFKGFVIIVRE